MANIEAVLFDLDDTLISEHAYIQSGFRHIATALSHRLDKSDKALYEKLMQLFTENPKNVFNRLLDAAGASYTKNDIMALVEAYRTHTPRITFYDDVLPCLTELKDLKIKTGIITDGYRLAQRQKLQAVRAAHYFDCIIVTDELGTDKKYWKPHPKAFESAQHLLNAHFSNMMYVGDNPEKDFHIQTIYPIKTVRIHRDGVHAGKNYMNSLREHYAINGLDELVSIIKQY